VSIRCSSYRHKIIILIYIYIYIFFVNLYQNLMMSCRRGKEGVQFWKGTWSV
jgi:hypothetical protein